MTRVAIVTGASRGIGHATAIRLAPRLRRRGDRGANADTLAATADAVRPADAEPSVLPLT